MTSSKASASVRGVRRRRACPPRPRRAGARASRRWSRPAAMPAQRARSTIGTRPAVLEVEPAAVLAGVLDDEPAQEAGRRAEGEREARELAQQGRVAARVAEGLGQRDAGADAPHRAAVDHDRDEDQRLLLRGVLEPALRRAAPGRQRADEQRVGGRGALRVDAQAAGRAAPRRPGGRRASAYSRIAASPSSPRHATALSTSEPGSASRRARLPSASQANGVGGAPTSATASSISRRMSASTTTEWMPAMCSGAVRARCSATIVGRRSRAACDELVGRRRARDRGAQVKRRPRLGGDEVGVLDDAEHLAGGRQRRGSGGRRDRACPATPRCPAGRPPRCRPAPSSPPRRARRRTARRPRRACAGRGR